MQIIIGKTNETQEAEWVQRASTKRKRAAWIGVWVLVKTLYPPGLGTSDTRSTMQKDRNEVSDGKAGQSATIWALSEIRNTFEGHQEGQILPHKKLQWAELRIQKEPTGVSWVDWKELGDRLLWRSPFDQLSDDSQSICSKAQECMGRQV